MLKNIFKRNKKFIEVTNMENGKKALLQKACVVGLAEAKDGCIVHYDAGRSKEKYPCSDNYHKIKAEIN